MLWPAEAEDEASNGQLSRVSRMKLAPVKVLSGQVTQCGPHDHPFCAAWVAFRIIVHINFERSRLTTTGCSSS